MAGTKVKVTQGKSTVSPPRMVLKSRDYVFKMSMFILKSKKLHDAYISVLQWWQILKGTGGAGFGHPGHPMATRLTCLWTESCNRQQTTLKTVPIGLGDSETFSNKKLSWFWQTRATRLEVSQGHQTWCHWFPNNML